MKNKPFVTISGNSILDFVNTCTRHRNLIEDRLSSKADVEFFFHKVLKEKIKLNSRSFKKIISERQKLRLLFESLLNSKNSSTQIPVWSLSTPISASFTLHKNINSKEKKIKVQYFAQNQCPEISILINLTMHFLNECNPIRLKKCKSPTCSHLFYDITKANSRLWCSMQSCGNLAKVRAFRMKLNSN